jgi:lactoylglutathione lyase
MSNPTEGYRFHHTMVRVKDPIKSREFYEKLLGMTLVGKKDFEAGKFSLYFYSYLSAGEKATLPNDEVKAWDWIWTHRGSFIELTQYVMTEKRMNRRFV